MVSVATFTGPLSSAASQASQFAAAQWSKVPTMPSFAEAKSAISSVPLSTYGIGAGVIAGATALGFGAKYAYDRYSAATASEAQTLESDSAKDARSLTLFGWVPQAISSRAQSSWGRARELVGLGPKAPAEDASDTEEVTLPDVTEIEEDAKSGVKAKTATAPIPMKTGRDIVTDEISVPLSVPHQVILVERF